MTDNLKVMIFDLEKLRDKKMYVVLRFKIVIFTATLLCVNKVQHLKMECIATFLYVGGVKVMLLNSLLLASK